MMQISFDLISDLHVETWPEFDWQYRATSPYCVVAGDVASDNKILRQTLKHLGQNYQAVFYIDGNAEHRHHYGDLKHSYAFLNKTINRISNVVFLRSNVIIMNGVAIVAVNGWWCYDFDVYVDYKRSQDWFEDRYQLEFGAANRFKELGHTDAAYLISTIKKLQTHQDVKRIVVVSHSVPFADLVSHDIDLVDTERMNIIGNKYLMMALDEDSEKKISTWCFGHYHGAVDRTIRNVRFVNNCRGRPNTKWCQAVYHPLKFEIEV